MKNIFKINKKTITITTIILYIIAILSFEFLYCNTTLIINLTHGQDLEYNFSLCRIVMYLLFFVLYFVFKNKFIDEAINVAKNKYKRIFIYLSLVGTGITIIATIFIIMKYIILIRAMSIALIAVAMGTVFIIYVSNNLIKNIIVTIFSIGLVFSISTKFNHALDEKKHFMSALNISYFNFNYEKDPITDLSIEKLPQLSKFTIIDEFLKNNYEPEKSEEVNLEDSPSTPAGYLAIFYIVPAIGIQIAKLLGGSIIDLYIMGRIFNLMLYGVLISIAVKLLPYKKNIFMVVFLMPMSLLLAASYSIDGICIGFVSLFIAYCLKLKKEKEVIGLKDFFILLGMFIILLLAKTMAYIMVGFIVFMLPIIPTLKKNKKYLPIIITIFIIVCIVLTILLVYIKETKIASDSRAPGNVNVSDQLTNVINNPLYTARVLILHVKNTLFNFNWIAMLHYDVFFGATGPAVMLPLMIFILYVALIEDDYNFKISDKIIMITSFLLTFFMTSMILYLVFSEVKSLSISGYQTRYILPILPLLLFCISNNKVKSVRSTNRNMNISIVSAAFIIISIAQSIIV